MTAAHRLSGLSDRVCSLDRVDAESVEVLIEEYGREKVVENERTERNGGAFWSEMRLKY